MRTAPNRLLALLPTVDRIYRGDWHWRNRYLEARVIVLNDAGDELFSQLDTLNGYLCAPREEEEEEEEKGVSMDGAAQPRPAANKEDIDEDDAAALEHGYSPRRVPGALFSGNEEEEEESGGSLARGHGTADGHSERGHGGDDAVVGGMDGGRQRSRLRAARVGEDVQGTAAAAANLVQAQDNGGADAVPQGESGAGVAQGGDSVRSGNSSSRDGPGAPQWVPEAASERGVSDSNTATGAGAEDDNPAAEEDEDEAKEMEDAASAVTLSDPEGSDAGGGGGGGELREGRARALLSAPGVDAATGVRGWKRGGGGGGGAEGNGGSGGGGGANAKKVSVVQDVLSVMFGWEVSTAAEKKAARGGGGDLGRAGPGGVSGGGAGVMFA